ncbi:MAG: sulfatase-like hydrolase/transferase [Frankiaceae bacterium]
MSARSRHLLLLCAVVAVVTAASALIVVSLPESKQSTVSAAAGAVVGPTRPNVLLVVLDDARYDALAYLPKTRSWLAWAARRYTSARTTVPACCPSRAALLTGRYPHNNGVLLQTDSASLDGDHTLMAYAKEAGYATAWAGKFLVGWPYGTPPPYADRSTVIKGGYGDYQAWVDGKPRTVSEYSTTFLGRQLRSYLTGFEADDSRPWLAVWAPQAPHVDGGFTSLATPEARHARTPVAPCAKPGEADRADKPPHVSWTAPDPAHAEALCESQVRALMSVDDQLDALFRQLKRTGEVGSTMIVITSDNGTHWGENGWSSAFYPYEPSVRVPLWVRWDGHVRAGADARLASLVDVLPTLLSTWQLEPTEPVDGRSLLSTATRSDYLTEYFYDGASNGPFPGWAALTNGKRVYIETYGLTSAGEPRVFREYYRLDSDPGEQVNVLRDADPGNDPPRSELAALAASLAAARTCIGTTCP